MAQATYYGEETTVVFTCDIEDDDNYGLISEVEIDRVFLYDVEVDHKKLPAELLEVFYELVDEIDPQDWE